MRVVHGPDDVRQALDGAIGCALEECYGSKPSVDAVGVRREGFRQRLAGQRRPDRRPQLQRHRHAVPARDAQ